MKIIKQEVQAVADLKAGYTLGHADVAILKELARIALASLEAEPVCVIDQSNLDYLKSGSDADVWPASRTEMGDVLLYRAAPPAPVSVPAAMEMDDDFDSAFEHGKAVGWNAYRAAMLQGADGTLTNEGTIPVTQFKPVADLYGLTSPTGGETSFTFDAVEARDFIDGGWSCQEYVELGRFQEAMLQNGNSPAQSDCCPEQNYIAPAQDGDSPVIPDGWVACSEQMPEDEQEVIVQNKMGYRYVSYFDEHSGLFFDMRGGNQMNCIEHIFVTHWMPLPAAPQQEVK
ncbi:DUF551 domain-containing protein [Enterobacter cloacae]|uniref:DUF551 domain-containing protein n=1 Tax=Enterobacter cloacae TaxID=550 RepID=UPI0039844EA6